MASALTETKRESPFTPASILRVDKFDHKELVAQRQGVMRLRTPEGRVVIETQIEKEGYTVSFDDF